jgi:hypothetical protein
MHKKELWNLYLWVRKRLTEEERKLIQATKPNLLVATERELAIQLKAKLTLITKIIEDSTTIENCEITQRLQR